MKIEAKQRLLSWTPNDIDKRSLWRQVIFLDTVKKIFGQDDYVQTKDRVPGLPQFVVYKGTGIKDGDIWLMSPKTREAIAHLTISPFGAIKQVSVAVVNPHYIGKGIGFRMYEYLLKKYGALRCGDELSVGASKMWARLIQKHKGYLRIPQDEGPLRVQIHGFIPDRKGFMWPVVQREGRLVSLGDILKKARNTNDEVWAIHNLTYVAEW